jgi:hypothetical protein
MSIGRADTWRQYLEPDGSEIHIYIYIYIFGEDLQIKPRSYYFHLSGSTSRRLQPSSSESKVVLEVPSSPIGANHLTVTRNKFLEVSTKSRNE